MRRLKRLWDLLKYSLLHGSDRRRTDAHRATCGDPECDEEHYA